MLHLLTETHLFVSLPNDCLCQMTGEPVIHMTPVTLRGSKQTSTAPVTKGNVQAGKRPFPFPDPHQDELRTKRLKTAASAPHQQRTDTTVAKYVSLNFSSSASFASNGRLDILLRIFCLFELGYSTLDHDIYPTRITLLLDCQIHVWLDLWSMLSGLTLAIRCA
jgi:hypothetical protein